MAFNRMIGAIAALAMLAGAGPLPRASDPGLPDDQMDMLIRQMNQSLAAFDSADTVSQVFIYRSLAAHGSRDPYDQEMILSAGAFASTKDGTPVLDALMQEADREYAAVPNGETRKYLGLAHVLGINPLMAKKLFATFPDGVRGQ